MPAVNLVPNCHGDKSRVLKIHYEPIPSQCNIPTTITLSRPFSLHLSGSNCCCPLFLCRTLIPTTQASSPMTPLNMGFRATINAVNSNDVVDAANIDVVASNTNVVTASAASGHHRIGLQHCVTLSSSMKEYYFSLESLDVGLFSTFTTNYDLQDVASDSAEHLMNIILCYKTLLKVSENLHVYKIVSLYRFALIDWVLLQQTAVLRQRCMESGNLEVLFRDAFLEYISGQYKRGYGLRRMKVIVKQGLADAKYL
ncbi:hypothetical protein VNO78_07461 [Psophocarpus tetragonolobus]|uniref:At2g35280-like TPR domain-containing protein n=1 Tax=Psophocarpus tetragonolobus TaxID=3891 RepID=A0AAN9STH1_PSOTE